MLGSDQPQDRSHATCDTTRHDTTRHDTTRQDCDTTRTRQNAVERRLHTSGVQGGRLDERQVVCLRKCHCLVRLHCTQVAQVALVAHQHNHYFSVCVVTQLLQPPTHTLEGLVLGDVVHQQRADSAAVVRVRDGTVPFLTSCAVQCSAVQCSAVQATLTNTT